jgi:DNA-binding NtrC family response regulator
MILPQMSGEAVFTRLRTIAPNCPIIICSGYTRNETVTSLLKQPHTVFLQKPFTLQELTAAVDRFSDTH